MYFLLGNKPSAYCLLRYYLLTYSYLVLYKEYKYHSGTRYTLYNICLFKYCIGSILKIHSIQYRFIQYYTRSICTFRYYRYTLYNTNIILEVLIPTKVLRDFLHNIRDRYLTGIIGITSTNIIPVEYK